MAQKFVCALGLLIGPSAVYNGLLVENLISGKVCVDEVVGKECATMIGDFNGIAKPREDVVLREVCHYICDVITKSNGLHPLKGTINGHNDAWIS